MESLKKIFNKHLLIHAGFMLIGMVFPMVAMAASSMGASATLGDVVIGGMDMFFSMIFDGIEAVIDIGPDLVENTLEGNFAPGSYEFGNMSSMYDMHEAGGHVMDHAAHLGDASASSDFASAAQGHSAHTGHVGEAISEPAANVNAGVQEAAASESLQKTFASRSEWFESLPLADQQKHINMANALGITVEEQTANLCNPLIPKNW